MTQTLSRAIDLVESATSALDLGGVADARVNAEWLLAGVLGVGRFGVYLANDVLDAPVVARYAELVRRRATGEPLQQILGREAFRGLSLSLTREALVPRPETETLVEWALELLPRGGARVIDVGTGSGCIACAIAAERPDVHVVALDLSPGAARVARRNTIATGVDTHVAIAIADLLGAVRPSSADMVVANPPYLPTSVYEATPREVRDWEPPVALVGGIDGLAVLRPLILDARRVLRSGAPLVLETAGGAQANTVAAMLRDASYAGVQTRADLTGTVRFIAAQWPGASSAGLARAVEGGCSKGAVEAPFDETAGLARAIEGGSSKGGEAPIRRIEGGCSTGGAAPRRRLDGGDARRVPSRRPSAGTGGAAPLRDE